MLYAKIALLALLASLLVGSPARPPQKQANDMLAPVRHLNLRWEHSLYLAKCRAEPMLPMDMSSIVLPGEADGGIVSLRVKTRSSA